LLHVRMPFFLFYHASYVTQTHLGAVAHLFYH